MRSSRSRNHLAVGAVLLALGSASSAAAQAPSGPPAGGGPAASGPDAPPTPAAKAEAQRLYVEAKALRDRGQVAEALERFRQSHDLAPTPVTRLELARMLVVVGRLREAHRLADAVAALPVTPTETAKGRDARKEAAALALELAPRIPRVTLAVTPPGADAEVLIDGAPVSKELLAGEQDLDPGEHVAVARVGERSVERRFTVREGERLTVDLPIPDPPAPSPPPTAVPVPVAAPPPTPPPAAPEPAVEDEGLTPAVPIAFSIAGVALATGIATGAVALVQAGDLKDGRCPAGQCPPGEAQDLLSEHEAMATTSNVAFAIAGAAAAVGIVVLAIDLADDPPPSAPPGASVRLRWAGTGLAAEGTWN